MTAKEQVIETRPCRYGMMSFFKNDNILSRSLREYGEWAQAEIDFLLYFMGSRDTVLDIGAFIGTHTLAFAQKVSGGGTVYAFEPQPTFFEVLKANIKQNGLKNVKAFNAAVLEKIGRIQIGDIDLHDTHNFGGNPVLVVGSTPSNAGSRPTVDVMTVDQLALKRCDLIKIDVENMEINVLRGARQTLRATRPVVFAECSSLEYGWPVLEFLKEQGYRTYLLNVRAYNPHNFRHNEDNFFGDGREAGLLLIPEEQHPAIQDHFDPVRYPSFIPISSMDDLALALLKKPQYKYEVLSQAKAASVLGVEFWATEPEVAQLQQTIQDRESLLAQKAEELARLNDEKERLGRDLGQTAQELQRKSAVLRQIFNSHGWKALSVYYRLRDKVLPKDIWRTRVTKLPRYAWEGMRLLRDMRLIAASGLFDSDWYLQQYPDVARAGVNPLRHYLRRGAKEGRDPNPYFDSDWYLRQNPDVARAGVNPLAHYLQCGAKEGRHPNPYFDSDLRSQQNPDIANALAPTRSNSSEGLSKAQNNENWRTMAPFPVRTARLMTNNKEEGGPHIGIGLVEHFGDIVACEPVVRYLREQTPEAEISWVVRESYRELLDSNPYVDRTIAVECLTDWIKLVAHGAFDRVIDLHVNKRICQRCKIPISKTLGDVSITGDNYFNHGSLLGSFSLGAGLPPLEEPPRVYISEEVVKTVDALGLPGKFVVFHCYSNESYKDWDPGKWKALAEYVVKVFRTPVVEVGLEPVLGFNIPNCINLCGKTSLLETAEVIRRAALFVGVESGPAHLANAVNTYGIVIMGQIGPFQRYNPYTGGYAHGSNAILIRNENGPATDIPLASVSQAIQCRLNPDRMDGENLTTADKTSSRAKISSREGLGVLRDSKVNRTDEELPRLIAFYLPQYYPIPENDAHWGKGFTEWRNVGKSCPFFEGQYQPRLPGELGYYDLRVPEIMERQAALAQEHEIHGFCYYLYWFQGKRLLNLPVDNMLRQGKPNQPFCFCWANENWTRRWDGMEREILVAQKHTPEDDIKFIRHFIPAFDDPRYIGVNGRPLLLIYRTELFPNPLQTVETWRSELRKAGLGDPYLVRCEGFDPWTKPEDIGFDASYEVPTFILPDELLYEKIQELNVSPEFTGRIFDYDKIVRYYSEREDVPYKRFKGIMLAWDNTPRHGKSAVVFHNVTPDKYAEWLRNAMLYTMRKFRGEERLVFINAWNEWAEGNYLEPDLRYGTNFLQATKRAYALGKRFDLGSPRISSPSTTPITTSSVESWQRTLQDKPTTDVACPERIRNEGIAVFSVDQDFSQYGEQRIILDFFSRQSRSFNEYCVDAGAYDGIVGSNSRALFLNGWRGVVIEPNPRAFARLQALYADRPDVTCVPRVLSDRRRENVPMKFAIGPAGIAEEDKWKYAQVSTLHHAFAASYEKDLAYVYETLTVSTDTLTNVLREMRAPKDIGFLSIDCEGEDVKIVRELDLENFRPLLICVEADDNSRHLYAEIVEPQGYSLHSYTVANAFFRLKD